MSSTLFLLISYAIFLQKVCLLNFCKNIIFIKKNICHKNSCFWQPSSQGCFSNFCHRNLLVNHVKTLSPNTSAPTQRPEIFAQNFITLETSFSSIYSFIIILFFFVFFFSKRKQFVIIMNNRPDWADNLQVKLLWNAAPKQTVAKWKTVVYYSASVIICRRNDRTLWLTLTNRSKQQQQQLVAAKRYSNWPLSIYDQLFAVDKPTTTTK